jgi:hypothetical protein
MAETAETGTTGKSAQVGRGIAIAGGVIVAASSWLNWGAETRLLGPARSAYKIAAKFVIDSDAKPGGVNLGVVMLLLGIATIAVAFSRVRRLGCVVIGLAAGVTGFLYVYQVHRAIADHHVPLSLSDAVAIGPYVAVIGGAAAVIGGVLQLIPPGFWSSLSSDEEDAASTAGSP